MYRSGPNFDFVEKHVPKWYVPKWSCTDLALPLDIYDFLSRKQFTFSGLVLMAHLLEITRSESNGYLIDKLT